MDKQNDMVYGACISKSCDKCYYGKLVSPKLMWCSQYKEKPTEVYFGGEKCPKFSSAKDGDFEWMEERIKNKCWKNL